MFFNIINPCYMPKLILAYSSLIFNPIINLNNISLLHVTNILQQEIKFNTLTVLKVFYKLNFTVSKSKNTLKYALIHILGHVNNYYKSLLYICSLLYHSIQNNISAYVRISKSLPHKSFNANVFTRPCTYVSCPVLVSGNTNVACFLSSS